MVNCYGNGIRYSLLAANSIIFLSGAIVLALGVWTVSDKSFMERVLGIHLYVASSVLLIVTGSIVSFIALLGSLGAYKELKCMLKTYFFILLTLLVVIVSLSAVCFVFRDELDEKLHDELQSSMQNYANDSRVTEAWDSMQTSFECCGLEGERGFEFWQRESSLFNSPDGPLVPESCCRSRDDEQSRRSCQGRQPRREDTHFEGCYDKMKTFIVNHTLAIGFVGISAMLLIAFGLILSGSLYIIVGRRGTQSKSFGDDDAAIEA